MPDTSVQSSPDIVIDAQTFIRCYAAGERNFKDIVLYRINLSGADLREVNLPKTHLSYVKFYESNWENSQFGKVISFVFINANLSHCNFTNSQIIYSDLRGVNLAGLDMTATNFLGSNLQGSQGSFNFLDVRLFSNTTWITGEFIPRRINADAH
jgi:uncharacterized protein YjbI with pentapeptide repeats